MDFKEISAWIVDNWDKICDVVEKLFATLMEKVG